MLFPKSIVLVFFTYLKLTTASSVCPGAPDSSYGKGTYDCAPPNCPQNGCGLHPTTDPTNFSVCVGQNRSLDVNCDPGTCFSWTHQGCVQPTEWTDSCKRFEDEHYSSTTTVQTSSTESSLQLCPGANPSQLQPGTVDCSKRPECSEELFASRTNISHSDPAFFYRCYTPKLWVRYKCAGDNCFSNSAQRCVSPKDWVNSCAEWGTIW